MKTKTMITTGVACAAAIVAMAAPANAEGRWGYHHPRQHEVLGRVARQDARIHYDRTHGKITGQEAHDLRAQDRAIAQEDRADARANGGYITKGQKVALNQQENAVSRSIYDEAH